MIRQLPVTYKTEAAALTYSEMGDVVVACATAVTITLPAPLDGLWYRISNVGAGAVTIDYSGTITTLKETEQAMLLANGSAAWWMSKGSGAMTKSEIEAVLTGEITSHSHSRAEYEPVTNGDEASPEVLFFNGDILMAEVQ